MGADMNFTGREGRGKREGERVSEQEKETEHLRVRGGRVGAPRGGGVQESVAAMERSGKYFTRWRGGRRRVRATERLPFFYLLFLISLLLCAILITTISVTIIIIATITTVVTGPSLLR
eukprot:GHVU01011141.1.p1 GENE.GHVU01011141.1~~GHVU01011141.1.p1  ORF type:complete len:119 (+),score=19.20 GHVU01011141.1:228-584(+)